MQSVARRLMPEERVGFCLCKLFGNSLGVLVMYSPAQLRAYLANLRRCGSVWMCPVCSSRISAARREELQRAIDSWAVSGGRVYLATYTVRHDRRMPLTEVLRKLLDPYGRMTGGRAYKELTEVGGVSYTVRALEVTWSEGDGWHPHLHVLLFVRPGAPAAARLEDALFPVWKRAVEVFKGETSREYGLRIDGDRDGAADYVAKFGRDRAPSRWTKADELTKWQLKTGSLKGDGERHYSPMDLLAWLFDTGESVPAARWREYARVMKGRHQLTWTPGMREALGMGPAKGDEELSEEEEPDAHILALITPDQWRVILYYEKRAELLRLASTGRPQPVLEFVQDLCIRYARVHGVKGAGSPGNQEA